MILNPLIQVSSSSRHLYRFSNLSSVAIQLSVMLTTGLESYFLDLCITRINIMSTMDIVSLIRYRFEL